MESVTLHRGGVDLPAALYRPQGDAARPALLVAPGGLARGDLDAYQWAGELFCAAGYVTLVATYSGASAASDAADLSAALDWLTQQPFVDSQRVAVFGHSRGGLSSMVLAASDARVRALVAVATPVDLARYVRALAGFAPAAAAAITQFMGGTPDDAPQAYEASDARRLAASIRQPVLLIHGTADMRVPVEYARTLEEALRQAGNTEVTLEMVPGMGHFLELGTLGYKFDAVTALTRAWLSRQLARE